MFALCFREKVTGYDYSNQVKITTVKRNEGEIFVAMLIDDWMHILVLVTPKTNPERLQQG